MDLLASLGLVPNSSLRVGANKFGLIIGSHDALDDLHQLIAYLALSGPVRVLDAGNHFNLIEIAYSIRRASPDLQTAAERIKVVRAFTCVEVLHALQQQKDVAPLVVLDMLATFYDDAVSDKRSVLLVQECLTEINRLKANAPVLVHVRDDQPKDSPRSGVLRVLEQGADLVDRAIVATAATEMRLF